MHVLLTVTPVPTGADLPWLGPLVGAIGIVVVAIITAISVIIGRFQDRRNDHAQSQDSAQPKIADGWQEVRDARAEATLYYNLYRAFENLYYVTLTALRHLSRTYREKNPDDQLDKDVVDALASVPPDTSQVK